MADKFGWLRRVGALLALYARMDAAWLMRDTRYCLIAIVSDLISNIAQVAGIYLLSARFGGVGDMSRLEVLFMLGYTTSVFGLYMLVFAANNTGHISRRIGRGQFDHMLMQPLSLPVQLMTEGFIPVSGSQNLLLGVGVMAYAANALGLHAGIAFVGHAAIQLVGSLVLIVGASYAFSSAAFWFPVACEEISSEIISGLTDINHYPLSGMPRAVQTGLLWLGSGMLGWFPACALLGKPPFGLPALLSCAAACAVLAVGVILFRKGMKRHARAGVARYLPWGFRG